jgi:hypothetical protein
MKQFAGNYLKGNKKIMACAPSRYKLMNFVTCSALCCIIDLLIQFNLHTQLYTRRGSQVPYKTSVLINYLAFIFAKSHVASVFSRLPPGDLCVTRSSINMNFARLKNMSCRRMTLITNQQNKKSPPHKGHWNANSIKMQRAGFKKLGQCIVLFDTQSTLKSTTFNSNQQK